MNLADYRTDKTLEANGVWLEFDGSQFLIASNKSKDYRRAMAKAGRAIPAVKIKKDPLILDQPVIEIMADTILLDFREVYDVTDGKKVLVPVTRENKIALLQIPELREFISESSQDLNNFKTEAEAEDAETLKSGAPVGS